MSHWHLILNSTSSLTGLAAGLILTIAFWRLHLFARTKATQVGLIACFVMLTLWLIGGLAMILVMVPLESVAEFMPTIFEIPHLWDTFWHVETAAYCAALLCLAWTLHRGIRGGGLHPSGPE